MITLLSFLKHFFSIRTLEEQYLSDAADLADLEYRMQQIERSHRPVFGY